MLACASIGYLLGRSKGMGLQGFMLGLAFGPLGWGLTLLLPRGAVSGPGPGRPSGPDSKSHPFGNQGRPGPAADSWAKENRRSTGQDTRGDRGNCPRCARPVETGAGVCPHCGNVLVPIRYQVNPGGADKSR